MNKVSSRKVCVVGAGKWGMNHVRTLFELQSLGGVVEVNKNRQQELKSLYPKIAIFSTVKESFKDQFDGYTVATPVETHFSLAKLILENGNHVLVEKPITLKKSDAVILNKIAEKLNVNLMTGHLLLFHPAIRKIREMLQVGKIGKLQYIYSNRLNLGAVRTEENILWSFAPHDISLFQFLIGKIPISVLSKGGAFLQPHIHDTTMTVLQYPENIVGHIFVSWLHPFKEHRLVVIGSKGMVSYEDSSEEKELLSLFLYASNHCLSLISGARTCIPGTGSNAGNTTLLNLSSPIKVANKSPGAIGVPTTTVGVPGLGIGINALKNKSLIFGSSPGSIGELASFRISSTTIPALV